MSNKPVYELKEGKILRRGDAVGMYDVTTGEILEVSSIIPKQILPQLRRMIEDELKLPQGKTLVEVFTGKDPHAREIPPEPPKGPEGDKTPAYAYWLRVYHPDEFAKRFAGRKVMGVLIPPQAGNLPDVPEPPAAKEPGDIPEDSMATESKEVWFRK